MIQPRSAPPLAFLTAAVTLFLQVLLHRLVSAKLLNNFAFLVISLTMLGFALSGVLLSRRLGRILERLSDWLAVWAALFAITTIAGAIALCRAPVPSVASRPDFVLAFLRFAPVSLALALPFLFAGLMLGALLAAPGLDARRVYGWDLAGSAIGALAVIPTISYLGVELGIPLACAIVVIGTLLLARPPRTAARVVAGVAALACVGAAAQRQTLFAIRYPPGSMLDSIQNAGPPWAIEYVAWDPIARIEVSRIAPPEPPGGFPSLIGRNAEFHQRFKRLITQNNFAFTYAVDYDGNRESLRGIEETIYAAAYAAQAAPRPRVFAIGVGGGFDILTALAFEARDVTAVEINAATIDILRRQYRDYFRHWVGDSRVHLVAGEGRHALRSRDERYDVLQLSGVDSYSGTAGAAHVFSENYLYTLEAFELYLSRLSDQGILNVMRLEHQPVREMLRALVTAVRALRNAGISEPARHVVMLTDVNGNFTALLVKRTPFLAEELDRLSAWADSAGTFVVSASPRSNAQRRNAYESFLDLGDPKREAAFVAAYPFDIGPALDDRPFFFRFSFWWHLYPASPMVWSTLPVMETSSVLLLLVAGLAGLLCVFLPLAFFARDGLRARGTPAAAVYFAGCGLGYLAVEIALMQQFGLFLGHPNHAVSVVLAAMLAASGLGALGAERILAACGGPRFVAYAFCAAVLFEQVLVKPRLDALSALPFAARVAIVFLLVLPIGVALGVFVPSGVERLKAAAPGLVPWAWGVNGIFSVIAPILAIAFSMTFGITLLLLLALPIYLVVGFVGSRFGSG